MLPLRVLLAVASVHVCLDLPDKQESVDTFAIRNEFIRMLAFAHPNSDSWTSLILFAYLTTTLVFRTLFFRFHSSDVLLMLSLLADASQSICLLFLIGPATNEYAILYDLAWALLAGLTRIVAFATYEGRTHKYATVVHALSYAKAASRLKLWVF